MDVTIPSGQTTSAAFRLGGHRIGAIRTPAALTGTALTFTTSDSEAGTYLPVWTDSAAVSLVVAASRHIAMGVDEANAIASCDWLKIVSGSTEAADRILSVVIDRGS